MSCFCITGDLLLTNGMFSSDVEGEGESLGFFTRDNSHFLSTENEPFNYRNCRNSNFSTIEVNRHGSISVRILSMLSNTYNNINKPVSG